MPSLTVVLSQLTVYGAMLAIPTLAPSTMKSTRMTMAPMLDAAAALSFTVRFTVAPGGESDGGCRTHHATHAAGHASSATGGHSAAGIGIALEPMPPPPHALRVAARAAAADSSAVGSACLKRSV